MAFDKFDSEKWEQTRILQADFAEHKRKKTLHAMRELIEGQDRDALRLALQDMPRLLRDGQNTIAYQLFRMAYDVFPDDYSIEWIRSWILENAL